MEILDKKNIKEGQEVYAYGLVLDDKEPLNNNVYGTRRVDPFKGVFLGGMGSQIQVYKGDRLLKRKEKVFVCNKPSLRVLSDKSSMMKAYLEDVKVSEEKIENYMKDLREAANKIKSNIRKASEL
jgi:hypothetical protein